MIQQQELYHEIFGSILDRREMMPYMLRKCETYDTALKNCNSMMANRGFDCTTPEVLESELERARKYVEQAQTYYLKSLLPFLETEIVSLSTVHSPERGEYTKALQDILAIKKIFSDTAFLNLIDDDPRHLFLLVSSRKYPLLFTGYKEGPFSLRSDWRNAACSVLKMCHLIKSIEEDSQDIHDYAQLGMFFSSHSIPLTNLFSFDWNNPPVLPKDAAAQRGFVKLSAFFRKLTESISWDETRKIFVFDSGDGVQVDIVEVKARLKSPESMFAKLGKDIEGEAYNIRDILALTFLLKSRDDSLTLFHALQKRGVILQENTASTSITQTLFDNPQDMKVAIERLLENLSKSTGKTVKPDEWQIRSSTEDFFNALSINAVKNPHTSDRHRKFQCKITFSLPIHYSSTTGEILIPGSLAYKNRAAIERTTQQHTLPVEIRISDVQSWENSEQKGEAHHAAYKCRQLMGLANRLFAPLFYFPSDAFPLLREDQEILYQ